jgi:hypothetical protein
MKKTTRSLLITLAIALTLGLSACSLLGKEQASQVESGTVDISVSPKSGEAGALINITGKGFPAKFKGNVYLGSMELGIGEEFYAEAAADDDGNLSTAFPLPAYWLDGTPVTQNSLIVLVGNEDGSFQAATTLTYTISPQTIIEPLLSYNPLSAPPGAQIEVSGFGFPPSSSASFRLITQNAMMNEGELANIPVGTDGTFKSPLTVPATWPGSETPINQEGIIIGAGDFLSQQPIVTFSFLNIATGSTIAGTLPAVNEDGSCGPKMIYGSSPNGYVAAPWVTLKSSPDPNASSLTSLQRCQTLLLGGRSSDNIWVAATLPGGMNGWIYALNVYPSTAVASLTVAAEITATASIPSHTGNSGLWVTLDGKKAVATLRGMPLNQDFSLMLTADGVKEATAVAKGKTNAVGAARVEFEIPSAWSDGTSITQTTLSLIASTPNGAARTAVITLAK